MSALAGPLGDLARAYRAYVGRIKGRMHRAKLAREEHRKQRQIARTRRMLCRTFDVPEHYADTVEPGRMAWPCTPMMARSCEYPHPKIFRYRFTVEGEPARFVVVPDPQHRNHT